MGVLYGISLGPAVGAAEYPALKPRKVLRVLHSIGYRVTRQRGSHRKLEAPGRLPIGFAFHDNKEVPPSALRHMLVDRAGLTDKEARRLL